MYNTIAIVMSSVYSAGNANFDQCCVQFNERNAF